MKEEEKKYSGKDAEIDQAFDRADGNTVIKYNDIRDDWYTRAHKLKTIEEFTEFLTEISKAPYDYNTSGYSVAAAAIGGAYLFAHLMGITGFQASFAFWEFYEEWGAVGARGAPARMLDYSDLVYPQMKYKFTSISPETWKWVQKKAAENLIKSTYATDNVKEHWKSIVDGNVPFGLKIVKP